MPISKPAQSSGSPRASNSRRPICLKGRECSWSCGMWIASTKSTSSIKAPWPPWSKAANWRRPLNPRPWICGIPPSQRSPRWRDRSSLRWMAPPPLSTSRRISRPSRPRLMYPASRATWRPCSSLNLIRCWRDRRRNGSRSKIPPPRHFHPTHPLRCVDLSFFFLSLFFTHLS